MPYIKKNSYKLREVLTDKDRVIIEQMFFGPYLPEWKNEKGIVDNSDPTIAARIGVEWAAVATYTLTLTDRHFRKVTKIRNNTKYELPEYLKIKH